MSSGWTRTTTEEPAKGRLSLFLRCAVFEPKSRLPKIRLEEEPKDDADQRAQEQGEGGADAILSWFHFDYSISII